MKKTNYWIILSATGLGLSMVNGNLGALNIVLPDIAAYFAVNTALSGWILLSFLLVNTVLVLVLGQFSDSYGRRKFYLLGLGIFAGASLLAGFSQDIWIFLILRVLQAVGGALVLTNNTALIADALPYEQLGRGLSLNTTISSASQLIGPAAGGLIAYHLGWQWIFWLNVPLGMISLLWGWYVFRHLPASGSGKPIDWAGGAITLVSFSGIIIALSEGGVLGWSHPLVLAGLGIGLALLPVLVYVEQRAISPMLDFSLFRNLNYSIANVTTFLCSFVRLSAVLLYSLYVQLGQGLSTRWAGLVILPLPLGMMIASPLAGSWSNRVTSRALSSAGLGICAIGLIIIWIGNMYGQQPAYVSSTVGLFLVGFGSGIFQTPNTRTILTSIPSDRRGFANGLRSTLQNMGQVIGTVVSLSIMTAALPPLLRDMIFAGNNGASLPASTANLLSHGYNLAWVVLILATLLGIILCSMQKKNA